MRSRIACSVAAAVLVAAAPALAEPTAAERTQAEVLFREGKKLMARGKIPDACEKFAVSYKLDPVAGALMNLANCHEIEGKTATAWTEFNEALSYAKKQGRADRQKAASDHIAALEPKLSRLTITLPAGGGPPGISIKLDGTAVAQAAIGAAIPVDPGDHVASATAPGKKPWEAKVTMTVGQKQELILPNLEEATPPPPPPPPDTSAAWKKPAGIAALGAGAVLLGVGTYFGARAVSLGGTVAGECPQKMCSPAGLEAVDDGRKAANIANGTLIAGGALAAAGTVLVILGVVATPAIPPKTARVTLAPAMGPGFAGLSAGGVW